MKFMVTWKIAPAHMPAAVTRFLETGGMPPKGVRMLGRWHGPGLGFALAECKDGKALFEWMSQWSDHLEFTLNPVVDDREGAPILKRTYKAR